VAGIAVLATVAAALAGGGCAKGRPTAAGKETAPAKTILATRQGESSIQVTESEIDGSQVVRINTRYRGEDHSIVLNIDQPVYEVEIPLTLEQIVPGAAGTAAAGASTPAGQFQDLLIAQYMEKAQEAMLNGDYQGALRQVNLVLLTRPEHPQAHTMKGSIYYAMGNYALANDEWEKVLQLDPSNQEVRQFQDFLKQRKGAPQPPLPGTPKGAAAPAAPAAPGTPAQPSAQPRR
jgi:Flp pilus assembly protein TadD